MAKVFPVPAEPRRFTGKHEGGITANNGDGGDIIKGQAGRGSIKIGLGIVNETMVVVVGILQSGVIFPSMPDGGRFPVLGCVGTLWLHDGPVLVAARQQQIPVPVHDLTGAGSGTAPGPCSPDLS